MSLYTYLLYFKVKNLEASEEKVKVINTVSAAISSYGFHSFNSNAENNFEDGSFLNVFVNSTSDYVFLKGKTDGLVTIDINENVNNKSDCKFTFENIKKLENVLKKDLNAYESKSHPAVRRGDELDVYYPTVDGRMAEYDYVQVLRDVQSPFQRVQVLKSLSLGNVLVLDGDINMSESDQLYSHTLMQKGKIDYKDKTCLILGGGDGGLLYEILQENPKFVVLVDIDEEVIKACHDLLPGVNKGVLEHRKGSHYEVVIGDALEYMKKCIETGKVFDYVLYDITATPVTKEPLSSEWSFLEESIQLSLKVLSAHVQSRFLCHSTALLAKDSLEMFDKLLSKLNPRLKWLTHPAFIPSFHEVSVFYEMWLQKEA